MRMGEGWVSPTQPAGRRRNPQCEAGIGAETPNGAASGAKFLGTTSIDNASKYDAPLASGRNRTNVSGPIVKSPRGLARHLCRRALRATLFSARTIQHVAGTSVSNMPDGPAPAYRDLAVAHAGYGGFRGGPPGNSAGPAAAGPSWWASA